MELREAIKVLDSDAHARDFDSEIRPYLPEPYRNQKAAFIPSEHYDRNLGGTLGRSGNKSRGAAGGHGHASKSIPPSCFRPAVWASAGCAIRSFRPRFAVPTTILSRIIAKASPRLKAVANLPVNDPDRMRQGA